MKIKNNIKEININDIKQQKTNQKKYFYVAELKKIGEKKIKEDFLEI